MSALAEALLSTQRQAIAALSKDYVASPEDGDYRAGKLVAMLDAMGCTDKVEQTHLLAALDTIREHGATAPSPTRGTNERPPEPITAAQRARIERDCKDRNLTPPDFEAAPITKAQASEIITSIENGSYDSGRWNPPF